MANDDEPVDGENPRSFTASMITRWQKRWTWFQCTTIGSKWRPSSFYANKTITKASHTSLHGHSTILTYESVLS
uniref:Uncharacterized protein n=1 Tax=Zea mays TaxID=4577 RepID=B6U3D8_MAIZE|nr:hypothetical protein [Zea mays]